MPGLGRFIVSLHYAAGFLVLLPLRSLAHSVKRYTRSLSEFISQWRPEHNLPGASGAMLSVGAVFFYRRKHASMYNPSVIIISCGMAVQVEYRKLKELERICDHVYFIIQASDVYAYHASYW